MLLIAAFDLGLVLDDEARDAVVVFDVLLNCLFGEEVLFIELLLLVEHLEHLLQEVQLRRIVPVLDVYVDLFDLFLASVVNDQQLNCFLDNFLELPQDLLPRHFLPGVEVALPGSFARRDAGRDGVNILNTDALIGGELIHGLI